MKPSVIFRWLVGLVLAVASGVTLGAGTVTISQTPAAASAVYTMGDTAKVLTYRITNTLNDATKRIYEVRFKLPCTATTCLSGTPTLFVGGAAAPGNWTVNYTATKPGEIKFTANSWADAIPYNGFADFALTFNMGRMAADTTEALREVRVKWTKQSPFAAKTDECKQTSCGAGAQGSWTLRSLRIVSLTPSVASVAVGGTFDLTMTVKNESTGAVTGIRSQPTPPTPSAAIVTTSSSPANINMDAWNGASPTNTITWTYTATATGTVTFTAYARNNSSTITSMPITSSPPVAIGGLSASIAINPAACVMTDDGITVTMTVKNNNTVGNFTNVQPSVLSKTELNGATLSAFVGPPEPPIATLTPGSSGTFTWTANATSSPYPASPPKPSFTVSGNATATGGVTSNTSTSAAVTIGGFPIVVSNTTNASSSNAGLTWQVLNRACGLSVKKLGVNIPVGFTVASDPYFAYSIVDLGGGNQVETWTDSGAASNPVNFTSPAAGDNMPDNQQGDFILFFGDTPAASGAYTFNLTVTDSADVARTVPTTVTVNPYDSSLGGPNYSDREVWREVFQ